VLEGVELARKPARVSESDPVVHGAPRSLCSLPAVSDPASTKVQHYWGDDFG